MSLFLPFFFFEGVPNKIFFTGPAIQLGVGSIKLMDRQAGGDLLSLNPGPGQDQVRGNETIILCVITLLY